MPSRPDTPYTVALLLQRFQKPFYIFAFSQRENVPQGGGLGRQPPFPIHLAVWYRQISPSIIACLRASSCLILKTAPSQRDCVCACGRNLSTHTNKYSCYPGIHSHLAASDLEPARKDDIRGSQQLRTQELAVHWISTFRWIPQHGYYSLKTFQTHSLLST